MCVYYFVRVIERFYFTEKAWLYGRKNALKRQLELWNRVFFLQNSPKCKINLTITYLTDTIAHSSEAKLVAGS